MFTISRKKNRKKILHEANENSCRGLSGIEKNVLCHISKNDLRKTYRNLKIGHLEIQFYP